MAKDSSSIGPVNWRARFFWGAEATYAIIGGAFEAYVYYAFTPRDAPDAVTITEAVARAVITQVMILLLGVAGVEIIRSHWHWVWKVPSFLFVQAVAFMFAVITYDLMRVAALAFQRPELLGSASNEGAIAIPLLGTITVIDLIAGLPFYQVAVNWVAHIITKDRTPLTAAQIREKAEADLAMVEYKTRKRQAQAQGWGATFAAVKVAATGRDVPDLSSGKGMGLGDTNAAGIANGDIDSGPLPANVSRLRPAGKGPWLAKDIAALVASQYGVSMTPEAALNAVKEAGKGAMKGTAYKCSILQGRAWVKRHYGEPKGEGSTAEVAG